MKKPTQFIIVVLLLSSLGGAVLSPQISASSNGTSSKAASQTVSPQKDAAVTNTTAQTPVATGVPPRTQTRAAAAPNAGEQIKWQVISGGGAKGTSTSFILTGTVGQTAAGPVSSPSYKLNQGFWQDFGSSCCVGKRGNVNQSGITDLADLSSLVSYLTGGGYVLPCYDAANVNGAGIVDLADLSSLVSYLTGGGYVLPNCP